MDQGLPPAGFPRCVLITGASGLVGRALLRRLSQNQPRTEIRLLGRSARGIREWEGIPAQGFGWNPAEGALDASALDGVDCIVHLAGETVAQRWSPAVKGRIRDSRIAALSLLEQACRRGNTAPRLVSASAIGWYPSADHVQRESTPSAPGSSPRSSGIGRPRPPRSAPRRGPSPCAPDSSSPPAEECWANWCPVPPRWGRHCPQAPNGKAGCTSRTSSAWS